jgi:PhzF family phenazine biosynthesis protein
MMTSGTLYRLSAFTTKLEGGNPAGVWVGEALPDRATMQQIATEVGYSETAFVVPRQGKIRTVRYYSPKCEVPFCGHATIALGVVLGETDGKGTYELSTNIGVVPVTVRQQDGLYEASLTSVEPQFAPATVALVDEALAALGWVQADLAPAIPPAKAYAGAWHLVLAIAASQRLADLNYDFERLKALMLREDLLTLQLIWRESETVFHSRNPFPVGGVVEDPATGAAAAALGGYLRSAELIPVPTKILIHQGVTMGRPSQIIVDIPSYGGIIVTGKAIKIIEGTIDV